jgi:hypothetical protein
VMSLSHRPFTSFKVMVVLLISTFFILDWTDTNGTSNFGTYGTVGRLVSTGSK